MRVLSYRNATIKEKNPIIVFKVVYTVEFVLFIRAVYRHNDIMLLDDPLSAVDAAVSRHLFDRYDQQLIH